MEEEKRGLHQQVSSFLSDVVSVSITVSLFLTHQQVRQLKEEKTHSQQRIREMGEEIHGLQQQVSMHDHCYVGVVNKHGTELLSWHKVLPRTHGSRSYTHANCLCTRVRREVGG